MKCKICDSDTKIIFNRRVLNKYDINFHQCTKCQFIQTEEPFWLNESYKSPINLEDTGLVERNILFAKRTSAVLFFLFNRKSFFLDFAAGYGLFVRLMRDYGFNFLWTDPFTENIFAKGFEYNQEQHKKIEAVTAFECFEHFSDPVSEIEKLLKISDNILFSTEVFNDKAPSPDVWEYYGFSHGQHISFYSLQTLKYIQKKFGLNLCTNGKSFHLFSIKKKSNFIFSTLLKISLLGVPSLIKAIIGTHTFSDSQLMKNSKKDNSK